ncbi:zinc finger protein schnurri [Dermatophagoides farinae]|uniref:zinc finger protein schnurri n=1 Tax=Dermatophagoides farinae TaxID=6954 RepID=UPI003F642EE0
MSFPLTATTVTSAMTTITSAITTQQHYHLNSHHHHHHHHPVHQYLNHHHTTQHPLSFDLIGGGGNGGQQHQQSKNTRTLLLDDQPLMMMTARNQSNHLIQMINFDPNNNNNPTVDQNQVPTIMLPTTTPTTTPPPQPRSIDIKRNEHRTTVPIRKQSVFVAPAGISSAIQQQQQQQQQQIHHRPTDQDISEHINKLIQENKAIVGESSQLSSLSHVGGFFQSSSPIMMATSSYDASNHLHHQRRSITNSSSPSSTSRNPNHHHQQQPYYPLRRHSSSSSSSLSLTTTTTTRTTGDPHQKSLQYSRLQSALLGDKCLLLENENQSTKLNDHHHHQQQQQQFSFHPSSLYMTQFPTTATTTIAQPWIMSATPTVIGYDPPSFNHHHDVMKKYSDNLLSTWSQQYAAALAASPVPVLPTNHTTTVTQSPTMNSSSSSSHSLFPSLFEPSQHHSPSLMKLTGRSDMCNQKSVIINATSSRTGTIHQNYLFDTQTSAGMNNGSSSSSSSSPSSSTGDPKNCLVRNLLLNSSGSNPNANNQNSVSQTKNGSSRAFNNDNSGQQSPSPTLTINDNRPMAMTDHHSKNGQKCIIKHLLLKPSSSDKNSKHSAEPTLISTKTTKATTTTTTTTTTLNNLSDSHLPPRKRSRCSVSNPSLNPTCNAQQQLETTIQQPPPPPPSQHQLLLSPAMHTCKFCAVPFRQEQNLEIHQKYYCCGGEQQQQQQQKQQVVSDSETSNKHSESIASTTSSITKQQPQQQQQQQQQQQRERKVCVLERPSIISYTAAINRRQDSNNNNDDSNQFSIPSSSASYNFGNILKSKLLSGFNSDNIYDDDGDDDYDDGDETTYHCPRHEKQHSNNDAETRQHSTSSSSIGLKKRKISEPAFRHWSSSRYYDYNNDTKRESAVNEYRDSILQNIQQQQHETLIPAMEIIPAYMPYLMRPPTKITLKGPILFPVLQNLLDTRTNYEFALDNDDKQQQQQQQVTTKDDTKFIVKQKEEIILDEIVRQLMDDMLMELDHGEQMNLLMADLLEAVDRGQQCMELAKKSLQRPTTLALNLNDHQQKQLSNGRKLSILINQCSMIDTNTNHNHNGSTNSVDCGDFGRQIKLMPSTLISPDTPRSQQKYQQLFLDGNAYSNLGLKVSLRPTYCCIYRLQPMYVMQEANPQLSMYSQWATHPVPEGHVLHTLESPCQLLSAYDSNEAVFHHHHNITQTMNRTSSSSLTTVATVNVDNDDQPPTIIVKEEQHQQHKQQPQQQQSTSSSSLSSCKQKGSIQEFLDTVKSRSSHMMNSDVLNHSKTSFTIRLTERTLKTIIWSIDSGIVDRICDSLTRMHYISTHSNYYHHQKQQQQQQQKRKSINQSSWNRSHRKSSRVSFTLVTTTTAPNNMIFGSVNNEENNKTSKVNETTTTAKRKNCSNQSGMTGNISNNPYLTMHPMLGHLPDKQAVMYIMMMSQIPPKLAAPNVQQIMSSTTTNLASRKFSECIGVKQKQFYPHSLYDACNNDHWHRLMASSSTNDDGSLLLPKRIKIFEGGFKSNEDYTYIRGRGRGKYVCGECGIRCKKPSMLKKHIRTHTDLRPYSCRHCSFAFKTKGNLTKHMKSKAHHKKCVELGILPVPTCIDDSQIDLEALAKQEQYELNRPDSNCATNRLLHCSNDDDEFDDDDMFDDDELDDDDQGVPIETQQPKQQPTNRLTYVEPGQFDDAINDDDMLKHSSNAEKKQKTDTNTNNQVETTRQRKISIVESEHHTIPSTLPSIMKSMVEENKNENPPQTPPTTTAMTTVGHNENETEAIHSLLILSSGATASNRDDCPRSSLKQQPNESKLTQNYNKIMQQQPQSSLVASSSLYPATANQRSLSKFMPEFYGYDTALLKPIINDSVDSMKIMINGPSPPLPPPPPPPPPAPAQLQPQSNQYRQPMSHPTSVIITNHQSIQHHAPTVDTSPRKRIRTTSLGDSSMTFETPNIIVSPPEPSPEISSKSPIVLSTIISNECPNANIVHHQSQNNNNNKLLQKIFSSVQQQQPSADSKSIHMMTKQQLVYHGQPLLVRPSSSSSSSSSPSPSPSPSTNAACSPVALPPIVEQSLNRYVVANNIAESSHSTPQQDEPIDLSSKKSSSNIGASSLNQPQSNNDINRATPEKPTKISSTTKLADHVRQSFSPLSQMEPSSNVVHHIDTTNGGGHQLYQNVRREEFAHLTPGIQSPHSLPRVIMIASNKTSSTGGGGGSQQQQCSPALTNSAMMMKTMAKSPTNYVDGGKPTCPTCMKQFTKPEQLRLHYKIHSFERLFRCESCAVSFRTKGHLQKHARSVSHMNKLNMNITFGRPSVDNPRPFKCSYCKIAFRIHGHLAKHLRSKAHIMKLECLGKLPFGMFAEMERNNINPGLIDTSDCGSALETLQSLAQKLYDPRQMCWNKNVIIDDIDKNNNNNNNNNNDESSSSNGGCNQDDSDSGAITEEYPYGDDDEDHSTSPDQKCNKIATTTTTNTTNNTGTTTMFASSINMAPTTRSSSSTLNGTIAATRSNTCHICFRLFKAAKFLQVHLYSEHADEMNKINNTTTSNTCDTMSHSNGNG